MSTFANLSARSLQRIVVVVISLTISIAATSQKTFASCGDYLHYGPMTGEYSSSMHGESTASDSISLWQQLLDSSRGQRGTTRCERGQCHQAPPPAPAESPRVVPVRDQSFVCKMSDQDESRQHRSWPRPVNGSLLADPYLEVLSPPPRHS